jgi:Phosphodiester glycosidase
VTPLPATAIETRSRWSSFERVRLGLDDGASTTAYVASYPLASAVVRVLRLPGLARLHAWCEEHDVSDALVGGFYVRQVGVPLGELRLGGVAQPFVPVTHPWAERRACVSVVGEIVRIARRDELPANPGGDLLQAGPLLVRDGRAVGGDEEGFSATADQFDSDITVGRHPRAALGFDGERLIAVACDGRAHDEAGLTLEELAHTMVRLGAREALNLDGGGSTSLVCGGCLRNRPREAHEVAVPGGREIATALVFGRR